MRFPITLTNPSLFSIKETARSGRGVYADLPIVKGTLLLETPDIAGKVIYREYRKEVCSQCFKYDRGREWKLRNAVTGVVFCSEACNANWSAEDESNDRVLSTALAAIEAIGKSGKSKPVDIDEDQENGTSHRPTAAEISAAWDNAEETAIRIMAARNSERPTKADRRVLTQAMAAAPYRDVLAFFLTGTICATLTPKLWSDVLELASDDEPYPSAFILHTHTTSYLHLLASLPLYILPQIRPERLRSLAQQSAHNAFNIWSQDLNLTPDSIGDTPDTEAGGAAGGSECLGYGVWPYASYFNHSCAPNVRKQRVGQTWKFSADRDIVPGEELCITYLGGDEKEMTKDDRLARLRFNWGFVCGCARCSEGAVRV